jgi:CheY-like chemotaxis protein
VLLPFSVETFEEKVTQPLPRTHSARRGRVLVVDDDPMIGRVVQRALRRAHDVVTVSAGRDAIDRVKRGERFDVVLCDLMMPEISGMDVYMEIQRLAPAQADGFIFLTGGAFTAAAQAFLDDVQNLRLDKPFDPLVLSSLVSDRVR